MVTFRRVAYNVLLIPALLIAPGCGSEPAKPPAGAPTEDAAATQPPEVDLGTESADPPGEATEDEAAPPESE